MSWYSQTSPPYASQLLGFNTDRRYTIYNFGCLVASISNLIKVATGRDIDPGQMNDYLKAHGGFTPGTGAVVWSAIPGLGGILSHGTANSLAATNAFLAPAPNFALIEVKNKQGGQHFVMGNLEGQAIDPEGGIERPITFYPFKLAHLYSATNLPVPGAPLVSGANETVTILAQAVNCRNWTPATVPTGPNTSEACPAAAIAHKGPIEITGWVKGEPISWNGHEDDIWLRTEVGHYFNQVFTNEK